MIVHRQMKQREGGSDHDEQIVETGLLVDAREESDVDGYRRRCADRGIPDDPCEIGGVLLLQLSG